MPSGNTVYHTFAIDNNIRRLPEDVNGMNDILARRTNGIGDVERHKGEGCARWCWRDGEEGNRG